MAGRRNNSSQAHLDSIRRSTLLFYPKASTEASVREMVFDIAYFPARKPQNEPAKRPSARDS